MKKGLTKGQISGMVKAKGGTYAKLATDNGLAPTSLYQALDKPYPNGERIIAQFIGLDPAEIWPDRYGVQDSHHADMSE